MRKYPGPLVTLGCSLILSSFQISTMQTKTSLSVPQLASSRLVEDSPSQATLTTSSLLRCRLLQTHRLNCFSFCVVVLVLNLNFDRKLKQGYRFSFLSVTAVVFAIFQMMFLFTGVAQADFCRSEIPKVSPRANICPSFCLIYQKIHRQPLLLSSGTTILKLKTTFERQN